MENLKTCKSCGQQYDYIDEPAEVKQGGDSICPTCWKEPKEPEMIEPDEAEFEEWLDEMYPEVEVYGQKHNTSYVLKEINPTAFRCAFADWASENERWECPACYKVHTSKEDAKDCCSES